MKDEKEPQKTERERIVVSDMVKMSFGKVSYFYKREMR